MSNTNPRKVIDLLPILSALIFSLFTTTYAFSSQCYSPSGSLYPSSHPCNPSAPASMCCSAGQTCLPNGLCEDLHASGNATYVRGSCTDKSWKSLECLWLCLNEMNDASIISCGTINGSTTYCCNSDPTSTTTCCGNSSNIFRLDSPAIQQASISASSASPSTTAAIETQRSTPIFTGTSTAPPYSGSTTPTLLPTPTFPTASSSPSQPLTATSSSSTPNPTPSPTTPTLLLILLLTTIPLTLSLLSLLLYTLLRRRRTRTHIACLEAQNRMLRWKTAKIEVVVDEEEGPGGDPHERRDAGGNESRDMLQEAHHAAYAEEVVREREDVGVGVPDGGTGLGIVVPSEAAGEGVRGWEYVVGEGVGGGRVQGRVERRERGRERQSTEGAGLRGYGYVTDVGARWF